MNDKDYLKLCTDIKLALGDIRVHIETGHIARACETIQNTLDFVSELERVARMPIVEKIQMMGRN